MAGHGAEHGGGGHGHAEHGKAEHGHDDHGHEKKGGKEGFLKMMSKQLRQVTSIVALFSLSMFAAETFVKPIAYEAAKGAMVTGPSVVGEAVSKVKLGGGGGHGGGGHGGGGHGHGGGH